MDEISTPAGMAPLRRLRSLIVGATLLLFGLLGLVLPVLPGWILIIAGTVVIAGAIPSLRRLISSAVTSSPARRVVAAAANHPTGRRLMSKAMARPEIRNGLTTSSRWRLLRVLLEKADRSQSSGDGS